VNFSYKKPGRFRRNQLGVASTVDFVLTLPLFIAALLIIVQIAMLAHAALVVRHAAYAAARSALVYLPDSDHAFRELDCCAFVDAWVNAEFVALGARLIGSDILGNDWKARAEAAAMSTLVSISPGSKSYASNLVPANWNEQSMQRYYEVLTRGHRARFTNRNAALLRKARYAHDKTNTTVKIETINLKNVTNPLGGNGGVSGILASADYLIDVYSAANHASRNENTFVNIPVSATVEFNFPLQIPIAALLFRNVKAKYPTRRIIVTVTLV